jgi:hypothetical protein
MTIPASKVKTLCTDSEAALVRASRRPELEKLPPARVKQLADRARKLATKWHGLERDQARTRGRQVGLGESDPNTRLKAEIFRDALNSFEAQLAKLDKSSAPPANAAGRKSKKDRSAEHRATRAAIRKGMTAAEDLMNLSTAKPKAASKQKTDAKPSVLPKPSLPAKPVGNAPAKSKSAGSLAAKPPAPAAPSFAAGKLPKIAPASVHAKRAPSTTKSKQRDAVAAAMQSRVVRSGKTTRGLGHLKSSTKRAQGRRDSKQ